MSNMDEWFHEMEEKGLVTTSSTWIERAVKQMHPRMTLDLATSLLLVYDEMEKTLAQRERLN